MLLLSHAAAPFYKNGYLLGCETTREAVVIDPGDEAADLIAAIARERLTVKFILLTHAHVDHVSGVARLKAATGAPVGLHRDDLPLYNAAVAQGEMFGYRIDPPPPPDFFFEIGGSPLWIGEYWIRVIHTPGHSPGGVCFQVGPTGSGGTDVFAGDTLFAGSIGRTDLPGGDYAALIRSIRSELLALEEGTGVHPGHGPRTTIGDERRSNPFLQD